MEAKKSKSADLESKKGIFLEVGLIVALSLSLAAFEWKSPVRKIAANQSWEKVTEEIVIKSTVIEDKKPLPQPVSAPTIRIVDNNTEVKSDIEINVDIKPQDIAPVYAAPILVALEEEKQVDTDEPFIVVERMPEFPASAAEIDVQGTVYVYFVVEKDGTISNIRTLRGIGGGCDQEAERVISMLPKWKPGEQRGKPVRVSYNVPVIFKLK